MKRDNRLKITPYGLLHMFTSDDMYKQHFYVILGRSGPTGKTWLATKLKEFGYNAIELSEGIGELVQYNDDRNHIRFDPIDKTVIIVLNELVRERKPKKEIKIVLDDDVSSINLITNIKDGNGLLMTQSKHLLSDLENGDEFDLRI